MNLLAIDTATDRFSVALTVGKGEPSCNTDTWVFEADAGLRHSELVMDSIDMLLKKAGIKPENLSGVVCMGGPGSFTGLRIGFSTAKGLALSLNIPFAAVPTLDCMAWPFSAWPGIVVPALDAKKGAFFCALYRNGTQIAPAMDAEPSEIARILAEQPPNHLLIGPGAPLLHEKLASAGTAGLSLGKDLRWGNAETLLRIAHETGKPGTIDFSSGPVYIRKSDAEIMLGNR